LAEKASPMYKSIQQRIQQSSVIGSDETGVKVNGKRNWFWTWQTNQLTYIAHSEKRGSEAINAHFPNGFPNSILVSDAWKPQLSTPAKHHQTCIAHLQRDIKYVNELFPKRTWGELFANLLSESLALKKEMSPSDYQHENIKRDKIIHEFEDLLKDAPSKDDKELITLYKRMVRDKNNLFNFLFIPEVPPDNNASERAIRMVKVKQKISGQFKTSKAAQNFAIIRSIIDTTRKNNQNVIDGLLAVAKYGYAY
jgi:transposase